MRTLRICCILAFAVASAILPLCTSGQYFQTDDDVWYDNYTGIVHAYAFTSADYGYTAYVAATLDTPSGSFYGDYLQNGWAEIDFLLDVADYGFGDYTLQADHSAYSLNYYDPSWWWYSQNPSCYELVSSGGASATCPSFLSGGNVWLGKLTETLYVSGTTVYYLGSSCSSNPVYQWATVLIGNWSKQDLSCAMADQYRIVATNPMCTSRPSDPNAGCYQYSTGTGCFETVCVGRTPRRVTSACDRFLDNFPIEQSSGCVH